MHPSIQINAADSSRRARALRRVAGSSVRVDVDVCKVMICEAGLLLSQAWRRARFETLTPKGGQERSAVVSVSSHQGFEPWKKRYGTELAAGEVVRLVES